MSTVIISIIFITNLSCATFSNIQNSTENSVPWNENVLHDPGTEYTVPVHFSTDTKLSATLSFCSPSHFHPFLCCFESDVTVIEFITITIYEHQQPSSDQPMATNKQR